MASSLINAHERHLVYTYLCNLVARSADARLRHVTDPDCVPDWITEHAEVLQCDSYLGRIDWSRADLRTMLGSLRDRGKRPRRDLAARHLRRLARTAGLSALDLAILEVLIRYKTSPVIESLLDRIDRFIAANSF